MYFELLNIKSLKTVNNFVTSLYGKTSCFWLTPSTERRTLRKAGFTQYFPSRSKGFAALTLAVTALAVFDAHEGRTGLARSCKGVVDWLAGAAGVNRTGAVGGTVLHLVRLATC